MGHADSPLVILIYFGKVNVEKIGKFPHDIFQN